MPQRGPVRNPNSRRGLVEARKAAKYAALGGHGPARVEPVAIPTPAGSPGELPTCPILPGRVATTWQTLVNDLAAAGVPLKQLDSRSIRVAAGYEADLDDLEAMCDLAGEAEQSLRLRLDTIKLK